MTTHRDLKRIIREHQRNTDQGVPFSWDGVRPRQSREATQGREALDDVCDSKRPPIGDRLQEWITARKRHELSHAHVQMARELGMNPRKLGKLDNAYQEPWKLPLPAFIESLYRKRFGKDRPDVVHSIEERVRHLEQKKAARREAKRLRREEAP